MMNLHIPRSFAAATVAAEAKIITALVESAQAQTLPLDFRPGAKQTLREILLEVSG